LAAGLGAALAAAFAALADLPAASAEAGINIAESRTAEINNRARLCFMAGLSNAKVTSGSRSGLGTNGF
jgi:hypothetical protein